jgi:hypothetical protein
VVDFPGADILLFFAALRLSTAALPPVLSVDSFLRYDVRQCCLLFPDVGVGQELGGELHGAGVDQLRLSSGTAVTAVCGLNVVVAEGVPEILS